MSTAPDRLLQAQFEQASAAFARGDLATARNLATQVVSRAPRAAPVRHLLALVERRLGNLAAARREFEAALAAAPADPQIHNNFANLLRDLGDPDRALGHYRQAIDTAPTYVDAMVNFAIAAKKLGRYEEARAMLERAVKVAPNLGKAWHMLGLVQRDLGDIDAACASFDRTLAIEPGNIRALHARALVEADRGGSALAFYDRAIALAPDNLELVQGRAAALHGEGDVAGAQAAIEKQLASRPDWAQGHVLLSQMRWQHGDVDATRSFTAALAAHSGDAALWVNYLATLNRAGRHGETLARIDGARRAIGQHVALDRIEAVAADETGDFARAAPLLDRLATDEDAPMQIARVRHLLRRSRYDEAAKLAERLTERPDALDAWAYLATAWRLIGDSRLEWLEGDPRLISIIDFDAVESLLPRLAEVLRALHLTRAHPLDQSLRGGTQTDGPLFARKTPEIQTLKQAIERAVAHHIAQLPPADPRHPTLRVPRNGFRFSGSWSVRLQAQGFHINHIHPQGWISSACYIALPPGIGAGSDEPAGWLALGQPPVELGLELRPTRLIEPRPGRLVLFPSTMWHGTVPFSDGERLTVAFDVVPTNR